MHVRDFGDRLVALGAVWFVSIVPRAKPETEARPRRTPVRNSGEDIVEAILDSASEILTREGYGKLTTNAVAERAGVSIGSLYQYFPDKQAVVAALARRLEYRSLAAFQSVLENEDLGSISEVAEALLRLLASEGLGDLRARRELLDNVPGRWTEDASREVDERVIAGLAKRLEQRADVRSGDRRFMAFVIVYAVEAVLEAAVRRQPELLTDESFLRELIELPSRFLAKREDER